MDYHNYSRFLWDMFWLFPCILGIGAIWYLFYIRKRKDKLNTVLISFSLSLFLLLVGVLGTWRSGYEIWVVVGAAHDISADLLYRGWKNSWVSLYICGFFSIVLYVIAVSVSFQKQTELIKSKKLKRVIFLSITPAILLVNLAMLLVLDFFINISAYPYYMYPFLIILLLSYWAVPSLGIPYMLYWGYHINKLRSDYGYSRKFWGVVSLFILSIPLLFIHMYWLIHEITHNHNPMIPYPLW